MGGLAIFLASLLAGKLYALEPAAAFRWAVWVLPLLLLGNLPFHPHLRRQTK